MDLTNSSRNSAVCAISTTATGNLEGQPAATLTTTAAGKIGRAICPSYATTAGETTWQDGKKTNGIRQ